MKLFTVRAGVLGVIQGFSLPLRNPVKDAKRVHPTLLPYLHLGNPNGGAGEYKRVPISPELMPGKHGPNMISDADLRKLRAHPTQLEDCEDHGYELVKAARDDDQRLLVYIDTNGSRHQPNTTSGWKVVRGRAENLLIAHCRPSAVARSSMCYVGLVLMYPGSELMIRPEGNKSFLLIYDSVEQGLVCDYDGLENRNHVTAAARHSHRDAMRAERLKKKEEKLAVFRRKNEEARRNRMRELKRMENYEREVRRRALKHAIRYAQKLRDVRDPKLRKELIEKRRKLLAHLRNKKARADRAQKFAVVA